MDRLWGCMEFAIQLIIILICLFYGARKGIALGLLGGIGLVILVFVFISSRANRRLM
nr:anaerobic C4-dicarboxylate transporter [Klebsiella pneumoniae]